MANKKHIAWLYKELPVLIDEGILDETTANRIHEKYGAAEGNTTNLALLITSILGTVFVGLGIILIFAVNWDNFSKELRTFLSFMPMVVAQCFYGYAFFKRRDSMAWTESTATFLMLMLASSLALVSQTYNISGSLQGFVLTWMILSIPLMYLSNATLPTLIYLLGISYWAIYGVFEIERVPRVTYYLLLLAALPHFYLNFRLGKPTVRQNLLGWFGVLTIAVGWMAMLEPNVEEQYFLLAMSGPLLFYCAGKFLFKADSLWKRPFQTVAIAVTTLFSLVMAYEFQRLNLDIGKAFEGKHFPAWATMVNLAVIFAAFIGGWALGIYRLVKGKQVNLFMLGFSILILLQILVGNKMGAVLTLFFNLYLLGFGIHYIQQGLKYHKLSLVNTGMAIISMLLVLRFFDANVGFMVKGVVFIMIGAAFLLTNIYLAKTMVTPENHK